MNRTQLEHIIRAASQISDDAEIVVIGSQSVHAQTMRLPPIAFISEEADVYPRNRPERADDIDFAIGELSSFHETHGYYAHGVSPTTAILPAGWEQRLISPIRTPLGRPDCAWMFTTSFFRNTPRGARRTWPSIKPWFAAGALPRRRC